MELSTADVKMAVDTVWVLFSGVLVFWMFAGFTFLEAGFARIRHITNVLAMNVGVVTVSAIVFWLGGFAFMFGNGNNFIGMTGFAPSFMSDVGFTSLAWATVPIAAKFFFQLMFADATVSIVSGIVAERMKFSAYMLFSILMVAFLYPITGHWIWGGGFLSHLAIPFQDFAGSTAVHSVGGWAALTGAIMVGARIGKYDAAGKPVPMKAHNLTFATLGTAILWMGWFGFNPGSTLSADPVAISHIMVTTIMASAASLGSALLASYWRFGKADMSAILNGALAGLVAITAGCNAVSVAGSLAIGFAAGLLCFYSAPLIDRLHIDDPVGVLSVHLVNGIWGTLAVGLFATKAASVGTYNGLFYGGGMGLLWTQLIGIVTVGAFSIVGSLACWYAVKKILGSLRVSAVSEMEGVDLSEHGTFSYTFDTDMQEEDIATDLAHLGFAPQMTHQTVAEKEATVV